MSDQVTPAVRAARRRLAEMIDPSTVELIDITVDGGEAVLRVHVRAGAAHDDIPRAVGGVRVVVVQGPGYAPERRS
jgi:hypothetical protein